MIRRTFALGIATVVLVGCLPIELDVSADGHVLIPRAEGFFSLDVTTGKVSLLYKPKSGKPVFARFLPDGQKMIAATDLGGGGMMVQATSMIAEDGTVVGLSDATEGATQGILVEQIDLATQTARRLFARTNVTYLTISRDGSLVALTRVADQQTAFSEENKENLPELHVVDLAAAKPRLMKDAGSVARIHRWFPDSKSVLVFQIKAKVENQYRGHLAKVEVDSGKVTVLAEAIGANDIFFDLSADGKTVLFTAIAAAQTGKAIKADAEMTEHLWVLDIEKGTVRKSDKRAKFAIFSGNGEQVLLGADNQGGELELRVADRGLSRVVDIATDAVARVGSTPGSDTAVYPCWIGDDRIAYLANHAVYGTAGKNLKLVVASVDGKSRQDMQRTIDAAVGVKENERDSPRPK